MTTVPDLINRARLEIGDRAIAFNEEAVGDGRTRRYQLSVRPLSSDTAVRVFVDGAPVRLLAGEDYTIDYEQGSITFRDAPAAGALIETTGSAYRYFSDVDWTTYVSTALVQHLHGRADLTAANLPPVEDYPVALLAVTEALYTLLNDAAFDIDIFTPEGVNIPRHQRYEQLNEMLVTRLMQYNLLSSALNVGLYRLETHDLRRVSRTTGRLVPIYLEREIEDTTFPNRVFPPLNLKGSTPAPDTVPDEEITIIQGKDYSRVVETGRDLTGKVVRVTLRKYRASAAFKFFDVVVNDAEAGTVTFSMDNLLTYTLAGGSYWWDLRVFDGSEVDSLVEGRVLIEERPRT